MNRPQEELMEAVLAKENLRAAWLQVKANDGAAGIDGMDVGRTKEHLRVHWEKIEAKLRGGKYQPAGVRVVEIPKPQGGTRRLGIPTVTDRLIEQALGQVLSTIWEPHFSEHSYGFDFGRSAPSTLWAACRQSVSRLPPPLGSTRTQCARCGEGSPRVCERGQRVGRGH